MTEVIRLAGQMSGGSNDYLKRRTKLPLHHSHGQQIHEF